MTNSFHITKSANRNSKSSTVTKSKGEGCRAPVCFHLYKVDQRCGWQKAQRRTQPKQKIVLFVFYTSVPTLNILDKFHIDSKSNYIILRRKIHPELSNPEQYLKSKLLEARSRQRRKNHNTLALFLLFWIPLPLLLFSSPACSCSSSSLNMDCEHFDVGTGTCTASTQPSLAPVSGYQHNTVSGTNYQCRNAGS